jgi:hypothetical protein
MLPYVPLCALMRPYAPLCSLLVPFGPLWSLMPLTRPCECCEERGEKHLTGYYCYQHKLSFCCLAKLSLATDCFGEHVAGVRHVHPSRFIGVRGGPFFVLVNDHKMKNCQSMHLVNDK